MIVSYKDKQSRDFAAGKRVKAFESFRRQAENRLEQLDAAALERLDRDLGLLIALLQADERGAGIPLAQM